MNGICHISAGKLVFNDKLTFTNPSLIGQEDRFTGAILNACQGDGRLATRIITHIENSLNGTDPYFIDWLNRDSGLVKDAPRTADNLLSGDTKSKTLDLNTFKKWIRHFKVYIADDVDATATKTYVKDTQNYGSEQAHKDGLEYLGRSIISEYLNRHRTIKNIDETSLNTIIWHDTAQEIIKQFLDISREFATSGDIKLDEDTINRLNNLNASIADINSRYKTTRENLSARRDELTDTIDKLNKRISATKKTLSGNLSDRLKEQYTKKLEDTRKELADAKLELSGVKDRLNSLTLEKYDEIYTDIFAPVVSKVYDALSFDSKFYKLKNQAALARNIIEHPADVKNEVFSLSMMQGIKDVFDPVGESDKVMLPDVSDDLIDNLDADDNPDSYNKGSQAWEDKLASDYKKFFGGNLYVYFNSIPRLNSTQKVGEDYDYNSDSELGTPTYYSAVEVINSLTAFCSCLSPETFIQSIEKLSQRDGYEGFIKIANDMRANPIFANAITSRMTLNVARKDMINIGVEGAHLRQSNLRAFPRNQIFLALSNNARNAYGVAYDNNDIGNIRDIKSRAEQTIKELDAARRKGENIKSFDTDIAKLANDATKIINKYFGKYFPDIDASKVVRHLYASNTNKLDFISSLFTALENYDKAISGVYERAINERQRVNEVNKKIRKYDEFGERDYAAERQLRQYPNENKINFNATTPSLRALTDIFYDIADAEIELNSRTAKDNMASDVIKNSYLTNFFKMLDDVVEESVVDTSNGKTINKLNYRGAELLKEFLTRKGSKFANGDNAFSTIIFGVKDLNGNTIKPGLFTQNIDGSITITDDNIKIIQGIKYALFSGVKNQIINNGTEYDSMSARDYYVSTILAFIHPIDYNNNLGTITGSRSTIGLGDFANFMMRIPSDASNNYIIQMPKLTTNGRYNFDISNQDVIASRYINSSLPVNEALVKARISSFYEDVSDYKFNKEGVRKHIPFPNRFENFTEALNFIDQVTGANVYQSQEYTVKADAALRRFEINPESAGHKELYNILIAQHPEIDNKNMMLIPFVYNGTDNKGVVFWALGYRKGDYITIASIESITTLDKKSSREDAIASFKNYYKENITSITDYLYDSSHIEKHRRIYNDNSQIVCGFRQQLQDSVAKMVNGIQSLLYLDTDGRYKIRKSIEGLFNNYHYKDGSTVKKVDNHLELSGNIFNSVKLFNINGFSAINNLKRDVSLYGDAQDNSIFITENDELVLNQESNSLFVLQEVDGESRLIPNFEALKDILSNITKEWLDNYDSYILEQNKQYANTLSQAGILLSDQPSVVSDAILNQTIINMEFDDLFEGSSAFYKDAQTFLKRAKEVQANGYLYMGAVDFTKNYDTSFQIVDDIKLPGEPENFADHTPISIRNSFKAVTMANTYTVYDRASELREALYKEYTRQELANASELADEVAAGYGYTSEKFKGAKTCANDAQSYITLDEFIRRRWADGTIDDYGDLLYKLKYNIPLNATEIKQVNQKIQAQKNVYFDKAFDDNTNVYYSRFIKNAEIVLIPQFLPEGSGLRALYDAMTELGIDQVNTGETSKASNKNFATFFDENGATNEDGTIKFYPDRFKAEAPALVESYFYRNLFKQQDIVDHIEDTENKAGIQIMKKIMDNAVSETDKDSEVVKQARQIIQDNFSANIKNDFHKLIRKCGWIIDKDGRIVNRDPSKRDSALNIDYFKRRFIEEAQRLGLDSDFLNYLKVDEQTGSFVIPTWLNSSADKMESIAQAIFNRNITRQTLPGFHAVQGSSVGASSKLHYYKEENGGLVAECKIPMWDSNIKKRYKEILDKKGEDTEENRRLAKQELIAELNKEGLDRFIGYRIPTEGKQSLVVFKVVDFLDDNLGSTMIVPHEWVSQTGSDFDIDTIYAITYPTVSKKNKPVSKFSTDTASNNLYADYFKKELNAYRDTLEEDTVEKFAFDEVYEDYKTKSANKVEITNNDYNRYISQLNVESGIMTPEEFNALPDTEKLSKDQRNTNIINAFMTIMGDSHSLEENASRSNFDDLLKGKNDNEKLFSETSAERSTYNPFDQVKFMQNAIDGRKLKAFSVTRDTFNSINNVVRTRLGNEHVIKVRYNLSQYNINTIRQAYNNVEIYDANDNRIYSIDDIKNEINSIKETAISNGTFMKAPNGKPTNLNEKQWLQVRTKAFKNWFGDWETNNIYTEFQNIISKHIDSYSKSGQTIDSISKGKNICLGTQMLCIEAIGDAFNNGDISHNVKAWPITIYAKSPVTDDIIDHYTTLVNINGNYYIFDMPQSEFIIPTGNTFIENNETHKEAKILDFKPRLISINETSLKTAYNIDDNSLKDVIKEINDKKEYLDNKPNFRINIQSILTNNVSKAIDENGEPKVFYHGTDAEFDTFELDTEYKRGRHLVHDPHSIFFTDTYEKAKNYKHDKVIPVFLNMRNPGYLSVLDDKNKTLKWYTDKENEIIRDNNYDSAIFVRYDKEGGTKPTTQWVVKDPNQIKSATDNSGLFSKTNNNIYDTSSEYAIVTHDRIGNSINNRNVLGRLITPYSSQTTAHILDAIKEGALYNETDFTFKVFKTLVDVGIDYDTAIAFLMQPAITRINNDYEQSNSIFTHSWASPINNTIIDLVTELNYGIDVNRYTNIPKLLEALSKTNFFEEFKEVWGTDISPLKGDNDFNIDGLVLDKETCKTRLKNKEISESKLPKDRKDLLYDLGIALLYKKYSNTSQNIEDIARCAKPDSFGAKQTIHSTKTVLENISNFISDERHASTLVDAEGRSILQAIYPNFTKNDDGTITLDEDASAYKYLAYFLKYSTIPSVNINSTIFDTEGPAFTNYTHMFEGLLGRPLKDDEYKEFKKYIISRLYYNDRILTNPITLDNDGRITFDSPVIIDNEGNYDVEAPSNRELERKEIRRIFGYDEAQDSDIFTVKDKYNPTEEELTIYKTLTPLQKINLIKRLWPNKSGIFGYTTTNKVYANELRSQGYSKNIIRINTFKKEMSVYYDEFLKAISNRNPLIKLAAADLIKYAYLVEGGRYRNNSITKTMPSEVLEADSNAFGMNLLFDFKTIFGNVINAPHTLDEHNSLLDAFIRSHPNLLKNTWISAPEGNGNIGDRFLASEEKVKDQNGNLTGIGLRKISVKDDELIRAITRGNNSNYRYIRINYRNTAKGPIINTLYKVVPHYTSNNIEGGSDNIDSFYLIPLPLLDVAEGYEVSQNEKYNNGYYSYEFYKDYINDKYPKDKDINLNLFKIITEKQTFSNVESPNSLQDSFDGKDNVSANQQTIASMFINRMVSLIDKRATVTDNKDLELPINTVTYIYTQNAKSSDVAKVFGRTSFARNTQQVIINGRTYSFDITRVSNGTINQINKATTTLDGRAKATGLIQDIAMTIPYGTKVDGLQIYSARLIPLEDTVSDIGNQSEDGSEEDFSMFKGIYSDFAMNKESSNIPEENNLANCVAQEISRNANNVNNEIAVAAKRKFYSKEINLDSFEDIVKHEKDVYEIALEYYRGMAKNLLTQIDAFSLDFHPDIDTKEENFYSIDNPELYDKLQIYPEAARRLYTLIVQCKYFGQNIKPILDNISTENDTIKELIDTINKVTNNIKVNAAVKFVFNKYIAQEYSTNPMIKARVVDLLDSFGDIDWMDNSFADILHTNNKLIQVVVKLASEVEAKAEFDAKDKLRDFDNFISDLQNKLGTETVQEALDKIIDKDGRFIREFKQEWLDTKENLQKAEDEAIERYGKYSKEHLIARYTKAVWFAKNVEQIGVEEYYDAKNKIEEELINSINLPIYTEYLELQDRLNNQYGRIADLSDAQLTERQNILEKLSGLRNNNPEFNKLILRQKDLDAKYTVGNGTALYIANKTHMEDICRRIKNAHPEKDIFQLMADYPEYKNAYEWLKYNSPIKYGKNVTTAVAKWRSILANTGERTEASKAYNDYLNNLKTKYSAFIDRYGNLDASKISLEELTTLKNLLYERDNLSTNSKFVDDRLIKVGQPDRILKPEYYNTGEEYIVDEEHRELYTKINDLIQKGLDHEPNGVPHLNLKKLSDSLTIDELTHLANYYFRLREINSESRADTEESDDKPKPTPTYNFAEYNANLKQLADVTDTEKRKLIKQILTHEYVTKKGKKGTNPNFYIYGYMGVPSSMIDKDRTAAKIELRDNIEYIPTDYYWQAKANAEELKKTNPTAYDEWYNANHYYNPREHRDMPLEIWTTMTIRPSSKLFTEDDKKLVDVPSYYDTDKAFKSIYTNKKFNPNGNNYKASSTYDNTAFKSLNAAEISLYRKLTWYSDYYAHNYRQRKFNKEGFAPRDYKEIVDKKWYEKQLLGFWGIAERNYTSQNEMKKFEYSDEFFTPYDMFTLLKTKDSLKEDILPRREDFDNEETYRKRLAEVEEANKKIREDNLKIDNSVLNRDWIQVYKILIERGEVANAKQDMKDLLYLTLSTLKNTTVPRMTTDKNIFGKLSRDKINSTVDNVVNNQEPQVRAAELFQSWMQKYLYGRFKTEHPFKKLADNIQAFTSAKYMMANVRGGIANVNTGLVNIIGEQLAGDAFNTKDFISAIQEYAVAAPGMVADFFNTDGKASNEISAICKLFEIVDLDEFTGAPSSRNELDITDVSKKVNTLLYGFMGGGEHFMQNSALIAMLNSHKVYIDPETEKTTIGTFEDFTAGIEIASFINAISDPNFISKHPELENLVNDFDSYRRSIAARNKNEEEKHKFETLRRNIVTEFIRSHYVPRNLKTELSKLYRDKVKVNKDAALEKFRGFESVRSQLEYDKTTGTEIIKKGSVLTNKDLAELKVKAIYTNKKIHGVYDKMGAAQIEQKYWWGSIVMQYHKHLYPGYLKRWRVKGYYNEVTHTNEKGSRISLIDLISAPFKGNIDFDENGNAITHFDTASDSEGKTGLRILTSLTARLSDLALEYAIYWNTMPEWERRNLMRNVGDLSGIVAGLLFTMLLYMLFSDKTRRNNKLVNTALYLADRLYSESRLYNLTGAYAEASTQMSQPVAAWGLISDSLKAISLLHQQLVDPDNFDPIYRNSQYRGQNKYLVLAKRNIPILRVVQRYNNVARNNNYFRINDNNSEQKVAKNVGLSLRDIVHPRDNRIYGANKSGENVYY